MPRHLRSIAATVVASLGGVPRWTPPAVVLGLVARPLISAAALLVLRSALNGLTHHAVASGTLWYVLLYAVLEAGGMNFASAWNARSTHCLGSVFLCLGILDQSWLRPRIVVATMSCICRFSAHFE